MKYLFAIFFSALLFGCGGGGESVAPQDQQNPGAVNLGGQVKILACGDSTMNATTTEATQAERMTRIFAAAGRDVYVEDASVAGKRLDELLNGTDGRNPPFEQLLKQKDGFQFVLENFAINDANSAVTESEFKANLLRFVALVRGSGKTPILITPAPEFTRDLYPFEDKFPRFVQVIRDVAREERVHLIDVNTQFSDVSVGDYIDAVHPKSELYARIAQFYVAELMKIFEAEIIG